MKKKKWDKQPINPLYCYAKECDSKFITKILMGKTSKALEFNNINYVTILPSNEASAKKVCY